MNPPTPTATLSYVRTSSDQPSDFGQPRTVVLVRKTRLNVAKFRATTNAAIFEMFQELSAMANLKGPIEQHVQNLLPAAERLYTAAANAVKCGDDDAEKVDAARKVMADFHKTWWAGKRERYKVYQMMVPADGSGAPFYLSVECLLETPP